MRPLVLLLWIIAAEGTSFGGDFPSPVTAENSAGLRLRVVRELETYYPETRFADFATVSTEAMLERVAPGSRVLAVEPSSLSFIRGLVPEKSVLARERLAGGILYLKLGFFGRRTVRNVRRIIAEEPPLAGLILDLRGNGGGLAGEGFHLAEIFLPPGRRMGKLHTVRKLPTEYTSSVTDSYSFSAVLLVDGDTASSAELFAAIMKAHRRAAIVGSSTHGKHSIQSVIPLDSRHVLLLTTGSFEVTGLEDEKKIAPDVSTANGNDPRQIAWNLFKKKQWP